MPTPTPDREQETPASDEVLDVTGLNCPLPVLKARREMRRLEPGQVLQVLATDPMSKVDFASYCARTGHELLAAEEQAGVFTFFLRRARDEHPSPLEP